MRKGERLRLCDWLLLPMCVLMLVSSVQLEGWWLGMGFVWIHVVLGMSFFSLIGWHLQLHYGWSNWLLRLMRQRVVSTRWLTVFGVLTLLSAFVATGHVLSKWQHSSIGGVHGKLGFVMLCFVGWHVWMRLRFYKGRRGYGK